MKNHRMNKKDDALPISMHLVHEKIGKKPRKPHSYDMRKQRGEPYDLEFCENYDKKIAKWEEKFEKLREESLKEKEKNDKLKETIVVKENPEVIPDYKLIVDDFFRMYKLQNKKDFSKTNPYSNNEEPIQYLYTLIFYFLRDDRFFRSPLLRKDLSKPSFDKGTLTIGGYGVGKTSTWNALIACFDFYVKIFNKTKPKNLKDLINTFEINKCVSSEIVNRFNRTDKKIAQDIITPLMSYKPLYIDDILREVNANNFGIVNIFLNVLTHRGDKEHKCHLTMNYSEAKDSKNNIIFEDAEKSIMKFQERYDGRVHDRIYGNCNIIELKSKTFRR